MKAKALTILAVLTLLSLPIAAQYEQPTSTIPEDDPEVTTEVTTEVDTNLAETEVEVETEVDTELAETEVDTELETEVDTELAQADTMDESDELPRTASPLALIALLGLGSGGAALGLRRARRS